MPNTTGDDVSEDALWGNNGDMASEDALWGGCVMGKQRRHGQHMYFPKIINIQKTSIKLDNFIEKCVFLYYSSS